MAMQSMTSENGHSEEESFVVLGSTSPKPSMDMSLLQSRILEETLGSIGQPNSKIAINGTSSIFDRSYNGSDSSLPLKINFKMEPLPTPASLIVADSIVTTCSNHSDMQLKIGELLDENTILRETLKENNNSLREQFKTIADWQDDVMKAHHLQKTKFAQTKELIEKLRFENTHLKNEVAIIKEAKMVQSVAVSAGSSSDPSSGNFECLPMNTGESTINNLTEQLEIVERQRKHVIADNDKILQEKDSLEQSLELMKKENDELKNMIRKSDEERKNCPVMDGNYVKALEVKITNLQTELKNSHIKLLETENIKLERTQIKQDSQEAIKQLNISIVDLKNRLREAHTITFQPIRYSLSLEAQCDSSEFSNFIENVKIYDRSLKDLAAYLNQHSQDFSTLFERVTQEVDKTHDAESIQCLLEIKQIIDSHHKTISIYNYQIKSCLTLLEKIFLDYQQVLKILKSEETDNASSEKQHRRQVDELTAKSLNHEEAAAFATREVDQLRLMVQQLQKESDERDLLRAQIEVYKADFEAERDARTQMASEKQELVTSLRALQKTNQDLLSSNSSASQATFSLAPLPPVSSESLTPLRSSGCCSTNSKQSKKKKEQADHQAFMAACTNALQEKEKDFADTVGAHVTERLRKIDPRKQLLVNYLINRTLCKAENEKLNTTSVITFGEDYFSDIGV